MKGQKSARWWVLLLPLAAGVVAWLVGRSQKRAPHPAAGQGTDQRAFNEPQTRPTPIPVPDIPLAEPVAVVVESGSVASAITVIPRPVEGRAAPFRLLTGQRRLLGWITGVASMILMFLGGVGLRWFPHQEWVLPTDGLTCVALGAAALGGAVWLLQVPYLREFNQRLPQARPVRWVLVYVGVVMLALFAEINGRWIVKTLEVSQHLQALLLVGGSGLVAFGLGGFSDLRLPRWSRRPSLLFVILLVALILRVWQIAGAFHIMIDELHFYDGVIHLWTRPNLPLLEHIDGLAALPHIFPYIEQLTIALFGRDFTGIRLTNALFGTLTVGAVYLLGSAIHDRKLGLLAAALLAVFPPHIHFSRMAMINLADPLFGTLAFALLIRALRFNRQSDYVLAGWILGWASYFYEGGRLVYTALFIAWIALLLLRLVPRQQWRGVGLAGLMALIMVMPYYYYAFTRGGGLAPRLTDQGRLGYLIRDLREQPVLGVLQSHWEGALRPAILHTIYSPDSSLFYYGGYTPIILWFVVPFYFLGLFYALYRMKGIGPLLWLWVIFGLLGISMVVSTDWTVRFCVLFPVMMLAVAIGLRYPLEMLWPRLLNRRWQNAILIAAVTVIGGIEVNYYFSDHLAVYNQQVRGGMRDFYDAFDRAAGMKDIQQIIFITDENVFNPVMDTLRPFSGIDMTYEIWKRSDGFVDKLANLPHDAAYAFALDPGDTETLKAVEARFPVEIAAVSAYPSTPLDRQYNLYIYRPSSAQSSR